MAWDRQIQLTVSKPAELLGLEISSLDIDFHIERSVTFQENSAEFTVYNASQITRSGLLVENGNIIFEAGYSDEGGISTIFIGSITDAISEKDGGDWATKIKAVSSFGSGQPLDYTLVELSYGANTQLAVPLQALATIMGLPVNGLSNAQVNLPNGWVYAGSARGALKYCRNILKTYGKEIFVDNAELIIYTPGQASKFETVFLDFDSGLISLTDITEKAEQETTRRKRVAFKSLLINKIQPDNPITFLHNDPALSGSYIVEKVIFDGDNFGGDFNCTGEAAA